MPLYTVTEAQHIDKDLVGLATPLTLSVGDTLEFLPGDYFTFPEKIDSFSIPNGVSLHNKSKTGTVQLVLKNSDLIRSGSLGIYLAYKRYDLPLKYRYKKRIRLAFKDTFKNNQWYLASDLNGWNPGVSPFKRYGDSLSIELNLSPGEYAYQFVKNKEWQLDPNNKLKKSNGQGGYNSVLVVPEPEREKIPYLYTLRNNDTAFTIAAVCKGNVVVTAFLENSILAEIKIVSHGDTALYTYKIPKINTPGKRKHIRIFSHSEYTSGNDLLIPLENGKVLDNYRNLERSDLESNILYFMMVDRFNNADPTNDYKMDEKLVKSKAQFKGGDLSGITEKISSGYFDRLGINSIWLSPISRNPRGAWGQFKDPDTKFSSYHGYWPIGLTKIDARFGTDNDLKVLISEAHKHKINVLLDYVAHHVHIEHPLVKQQPEWFTSLYLPDGTLNTEKWDEYRLTTWFDTFLPTLNLGDKKVAEYMVDSALYWLKNYAIDGFRHDATKHIPLNFWRTLSHKIKKEVSIPQDKLIYQIGETYGNNELIESYINSGMLNAQFDFNLYDALLPVFAQNRSFIQLEQALRSSFEHYGHHHLMGNICGNQDKPRFISYADGQINEKMPWIETKRLGWKKNIEVSDTNAYKKLASAEAFNLTIPGIPVIYYGDEIGMPGANDPDNRRMMKFENLNERESGLRELTAKLINFRRTNMSLMYGDFQFLSITDDLMAYSRKYFDEIIWIIFNKTDRFIDFEYKRPAGYKEIIQFGERYTYNTFDIKIRVEPYSFSIMKWTKKK
ncbi:MAG: alpha-amylase [Flavobacteriales bacterium]|nr:alpha-amylase [Flavobacteriales bacterium]